MSAKKPAQRQRIKDFSNLVWCLNNLSDSDLDKADAMAFDLERFGEWLDLLVERDGMEFKFGWDTYSNTWQGTLMGAWQGFTNSSHAVSARSSGGFADVARLLVFKFDAIAQGDLPSIAEEKSSRRKRG